MCINKIVHDEIENVKLWMDLYVHKIMSEGPDGHFYLLDKLNVDGYQTFQRWKKNPSVIRPSCIDSCACCDRSVNGETGEVTTDVPRK